MFQDYCHIGYDLETMIKRTSEKCIIHLSGFIIKENIAIMT